MDAKEDALGTKRPRECVMGATDLQEGDETFWGKTCSWEGAEPGHDQAEQQLVEMKKLKGKSLIGRKNELTGLENSHGTRGSLL